MQAIVTTESIGKQYGNLPSILITIHYPNGKDKFKETNSLKFINADSIQDDYIDSIDSTTDECIAIYIDRKSKSKTKKVYDYLKDTLTPEYISSKDTLVEVYYNIKTLSLLSLKL